MTLKLELSHPKRKGPTRSGFASIVAVAALVVFASPAHAAEELAPAAAQASGASSVYGPMEPFAALAGRVLRGVGKGPDGKPIVDIAHWEFILDGRALQSTHKLLDHAYGGRTIFFYDEAAKSYVFHYFTTAGFHTTGTAEVIDGGFAAFEKVIGHPEFAEVRSTMTVDGDRVVVSSSHITKDGVAGEASEMIYEPFDGPAPFESSAE